MRVRALLALLVLLGILPVQGGAGAGAGRSEAGPVVLYLDVAGGAQNLSLSAPASNGSVVLGRNMSANFTIDSLSGLYDGGTDWFALNLSLVSLNLSGMELSCRLDLDYMGDGSDTRTLAFRNYSTGNATVVERALVLPVEVDRGAYDADLRNGSLRLELARVDGSDGLLEILCGQGDNSSSVSIPYGGPLRADAGPDRRERTGRTVAFNGSLSESVDPDNTTYIWDLGDNLTKQGERVSTAYANPGTYTVRLTLFWNGQKAEDTAVITVLGNRPPVADDGLNVTRLTRRVGESTAFRGNGSDPDGDPVTYNWSFGDGTFASGRNVSHSFSLPGDYLVVLTVRDDGGAEGQDSLNLHINFPPELSNLTATRNGAVWSFQVSVQDREGAIPRYNWSFGDGSTGNASRPTHTYNASGTYTVRVVVTDSYEDTGSLSINVTVTNSAPRIATMKISKTVSTVNEPVGFQAYATDADGDPLTYRWDFGDGAKSALQNATHSYARAGRFTVTLTVSDGTDLTTRTGTVTVNEGSGLEDPTIWALLPCILVFLVLLIIVLARSAAEARKRQEQGGQYGGTEPRPTAGLPAPTQPSGGQYEPYGGPYQPYGGAQYPAAPALAKAARPAKAPPGVCPRCGSTDLQSFPDGHAKCQNCKKIFFTG